MQGQNFSPVSLGSPAGLSAGHVPLMAHRERSLCVWTRLTSQERESLVRSTVSASVFANAAYGVECFFGKIYLESPLVSEDSFWIAALASDHTEA